MNKKIHEKKENLKEEKNIEKVIENSVYNTSLILAIVSIIIYLISQYIIKANISENANTFFTASFTIYSLFMMNALEPIAHMNLVSFKKIDLKEYEKEYKLNIMASKLYSLICVLIAALIYICALLIDF
ncbi:hypothetical protein [Staphylococcus epidermidis]|uniref:hypothetical protein n=1 Tax=Staphylococcus epidermidis TaxID=1282 RepID=UPI0034D52B48